ncbi:hypothetical protein MAR_019715, partial [Mya arenaria]
MNHSPGYQHPGRNDTGRDLLTGSGRYVQPERQRTGRNELTGRTGYGLAEQRYEHGQSHPYRQSSYEDVGCIPPPVPEGLEWDPVSVVIPLNSTDNYSSLQRLLRASYKTRYVSKNAINHNDPGGYRIRVDATTYGAEIIHRMTSHMSSTTFNRLASHATVGIFTSWEHITIFPEYYSVANPAGCCCAGQCRTSCTFDGRKYFKLAGAGGQRTGILDDNILCNSADPYHGRANILVHEFAHTVKLHGLDGWMHTRTEEEYFAVGSSVFMNADRLGPDTNVHGGLQINTCGSSACSTEYASKTNIFNHGITIFYITRRCGSSACSTEYASKTNIFNHDITIFYITRRCGSSACSTEYAVRFNGVQHGVRRCGSTACSTEYAGKTNIYNHDITLYSILIEVYGNNQDITYNLSPTDQHPSLQRLLRASYKTRYVSKNAVNHNDPGGYRIRVDATTHVSDHALNTGAEIIHRMTSHMSSATFNRLASHATVGIFTSWEHITIFPEYYSVANPAGCCEQDHAWGQRTGILDDNILCNDNDPYRYGRSNILVHEFAHTVKLYGLAGWMLTRITNAFKAAQGNHAWAPGQYAMQTEEEYFAVGSSVFMNADRRGPNANVNGIQMNVYVQ